MRLIRLHPNSPEAWALWPIFEQRCIDFIRDESREGDPEQFRKWIRESFVQRHEIQGAWLAIEGTDKVIGHLLGWADHFFGDPYIFIHQVKTDPNATIDNGLRDAMCEALHQWVDECNWAYEQAQSPLRIRKIRFATGRGDRAWKAYLKPLGLIEKERSILTITVGSERPEIAPELSPPPGAVRTHVNGHQGEL